MLVKALGAIDLIAGIILIFATSINLPNQVLIIFGVVLLAKSSLGFLKDFASWVDFLCAGIFLVSIIISVPAIISLIFGLLLLQKGIFSFL
jgi:hypothetical protein